MTPTVKDGEEILSKQGKAMRKNTNVPTILQHIVAIPKTGLEMMVVK